MRPTSDQLASLFFSVAGCSEVGRMRPTSDPTNSFIIIIFFFFFFPGPCCPPNSGNTKNQEALLSSQRVLADKANRESYRLAFWPTQDSNPKP